jgi:hypothetical protein
VNLLRLGGIKDNSNVLDTNRRGSICLILLKHQHSLLARKVLPPLEGGFFFDIISSTMATLQSTRSVAPSEQEVIIAISFKPFFEDLFPLNMLLEASYS